MSGIQVWVSLHRLPLVSFILVIGLGYGLVAEVSAQTDVPVQGPFTDDPDPPDDPPSPAVLPATVPDPLEPANRILGGLGFAFLKYVVNPTSKAYRLVVIRPARTGITNFGRNIVYPDRLLNNLLEGKWTGARNESSRFLINSVAGVGGLIDVASRWRIPKSEADFGRTFEKWGWKPHFFLLALSPSNERDALGYGADSAADPISYFFPYSLYSYGVMYNNLTNEVDMDLRMVQLEQDPYAELQYTWNFVRERQLPPRPMNGLRDEAAAETVRAAFLTFRDPNFPNRGKTDAVWIKSTGKKLKFTYWLQPKKAPVVYLLPGLGAHRLSDHALALAELAYRKGYSVVTVSSVFNYEFMENASTVAMPAYVPADGHDLHVALTEVDRRLKSLCAPRLGSRILMGYSMGAFHTLFIAANEEGQPAPLLKFDRYVAISPPVRLRYAASVLDEYFSAALAWPAEDRTRKIEDAYLRLAALGQSHRKWRAPMPLDITEARYFVGLAFRLNLRDMLFISQQRHNQGILKQPLGQLKRAAVYREIMQYSYKDYFEKFVIPYYQSRGIDMSEPEARRKAADLRTLTPALSANSKIRLLLNRDDPLIADEDLEWFGSTFERPQLVIFERGGHLGNLGQPAMQKAIIHALGN